MLTFFLSRESDLGTPTLPRRRAKAIPSLGFGDTARGLVKEPAHDDEHHESVDEGGEHLDAAVSEGVVVVRPVARHHVREKREKETRRVRHHVPGVADQRERIGPEAAHEFQKGEPERERHGETEDARLHLVGDVNVGAVALSVTREAVVLMRGGSGGFCHDDAGRKRKFRTLHSTDTEAKKQIKRGTATLANPSHF